jgi:hypothetical protein
MIGLIARHGTTIVIATAPTREAAEEIALELFAEFGLFLEGVEIPMVVFDPNDTGGLILDPTMPDPFEEVDSMEGWTLDGFNAP